MGPSTAQRGGSWHRSGVAAIAAQATQAAGSLLLQVVGARQLGLTGLGEFGVLYGVMVLATAIASGFVGDSMTVLDRHTSAVRAALQNWLLLIAGLCAAACFLATWLTEFVDFHAAVAFGGATFCFLIEDALRRLLMATLKFWRIVALDLTSLLTMVAILVLAPTVTLAWLFLALMIGQVAAIAIGICLLPQRERWLASPFPADYAAVARYGIWRALQQAVRPSLLALTRVTVVAALGLAAAGELEAARIYTAPAMLAVFGLSGFLFANFAVDREQPMRTALRAADRGVLVLVVVILLFGVGAVLIIPLLGPLLTGGEYDISVLTVTGWLVYTLSVATVTPYGALAAVRGLQAAVLVVRIADSVFSLALAAALVYLVRSIEWVPIGLAVGSVAGGVAIRQYVLRRMVDSSG